VDGMSMAPTERGERDGRVVGKARNLLVLNLNVIATLSK